MSNQANIRDIEALSDLKAAFGRFGEDVVTILPPIERQFEAVLEWVEERQRYWGQQVDQERDELHDAKHDLHICRRRADRDEECVDCSCEEERVADAERALAQYESNWETAKQWRHRIESQIDELQRHIHRLSHLASARANSAQAFLANKSEILSCYLDGDGASGVDYASSAPSPARNGPGSVPDEKGAPRLPSKLESGTIGNSRRNEEWGHPSASDYRATFFAAYPFLRGHVVVHHAVEQRVLQRYPGLITEAEIHSLENLRGIPKEINNALHLSMIRSEWNEFDRQHQNPTKEQLIQKATDIDVKYGHSFMPPTGEKLQ